MSYAGLVSVIIPTKNSERTIGQCLQSILNQNYSNVEVLVIDAYSTDKTKEISSGLGANVISLEGERTYAKNYGTDVCKGEFVFFIDSDMILKPSVIHECIDKCKNYQGVIIPEHSVGSSLWVKIRDFERSLYSGSKIESARFFVRKYVQEVDGFDTDIVAYEESTLPQKLEMKGYRVNGRISAYIMHDENRFSIWKWLRKKRYYNETSNVYYSRYEEYARLQFSQSYRLRVFFSNGKWKTLIRHPMLSIGLFTLKTLELISSR